MEWMETNGVVLRYELSGTGQVPLLLIHELGGSLEFWDPVLPALQQAFRVLRYDLRGFGMSEKVKVLHIDDMTGDIAGLLDALGITEPCHVVGPALGAGIALAFAARYPSRVRRLVVSSPATGVPPERRAQSLERAATVERSGMRASVEPSLARSYPERFRSNQQHFEQYRRRWLCNDPEGFAAINRMLTKMDLTQQYGRITCPTLVMGCTYDTIRPPHEVEPIAGPFLGRATLRWPVAILCRTRHRNCLSKQFCRSCRKLRCPSWQSCIYDLRPGRATGRSPLRGGARSCSSHQPDDLSGASPTYQGDKRMALKDQIALGMCLPHRSPDPIPVSVIRHVALRAEALGFRDLWVTENTLDPASCLDALTLLTYAAAITTTIRVGVSVLVLPVHSPVHVAHRVATLDYLSGGRAILGIGLGRDHHYTEFQIPRERRVRRFREALELMKALWTEPKVTYNGEIFQLHDGVMGPKPVQKPYPPIWLGGGHPDALRRVVLADGWMGAGGSSTAAFGKSVPLVRAALEEAGRDATSFPISKRVFMSVHENPEVAKAEVHRWFSTVYHNPDLTTEGGVYGTPEQVRQQLQELVAMGANHLLLNPVTRFAEQVEALAEVAGLA